MNNLWDRFGYVGLVCYTGYKDRVRELKPELERVGLWDRVHPHWDFPSIFRDRLFKAVGKTTYCSKNNCFFMTVMHYNVVKTAYELGFNSILVLEDDIRFLKDLYRMEKILASMPEDYDMVMFDRSKPGEMAIEEWRASNLYQGECEWKRLVSSTSTGCYSLSRRGMEHYIDILEQDVNRDSLRNPDYYFRANINGTEYWDKTYNRYYCAPNLCMQTICGNGKSHCSMQAYWETFDRTMVTQDMYNLKYPVVTRGNFLDLLYDRVDKQNKELAYGVVYVPTKEELILPSLHGVCKSVSYDMRADMCSIWGNGTGTGNIKALQKSYIDDSQLLLCEDGFIRSYDTWCGTSSAKYKQSHSIIFDTKGYYFDATRISLIEGLLNNSEVVVSDVQRKEARELIRKIVDNKVSKYNHQPIYTPSIGRYGKPKVLIVDQSYGDFSIAKGMADDTTFEKMLEAAINENPDADILVKTHPDTMAGKKAEKKGYYQDLVEHDNIYKVTFPINPYSLLEVCDKVYVCSSQFGFEALMAGKEVHVFGMPFYAGWGLTIDAQHLERRTNKRTLEELFYIFYCIYTHWVDPDQGCETTIDAVIDKMIALRKEVNSCTKKSRNHECLFLDDGFRVVARPRVSPSVDSVNPTITTRKQVEVLPRKGVSRNNFHR